MAVTYNNGSQVSLFNDTTINISPDLLINVTSVDCLILSGLGSPTFTTNNNIISALVQLEATDEYLGIKILRTPVSISVQLSFENQNHTYVYILGYHICSGNNRETFVVRLTAGKFVL